MEKVSLYFPPVSGLAQPLLPPPRPAFPLPLLLSGSAHFFSPAACLPPSPFLLLAPAQRQSARLAAQEDNQRRAPPLPSPQQMTGRPHASVSPTGGAQRSGSSSTLSPSRTRPSATKSRAFRASSPFSACLSPFIYSPRCPQPPIFTRAPAATFKLAKSPPRSTSQPIRHCSASQAL